MQKIDIKKELDDLYDASAKALTPRIVDVPALNYLVIDGSGNPNTSCEYQEAVETLFGLSYAIKFMIKKGSEGIDYRVFPLEGLWWTDDISQFSVEKKDDWHWTSLIMQPHFVTESIVKAAVEEVKRKKNLPALHKIRFETVIEGVTAQILHIGPYADEAPTVDKLHRFIVENGYECRGKHHEIYLSDPRKAAPGKMKTIIRQPIRTI